MQYLFLVGAILSEVVATLSLRAAVQGRTGLYVLVVIGYVAAFSLLLGALRGGMPLGIAYGVWIASGVAIIAIASRFLFGEPLTRRMVAGIGLIVIGVLVLETGMTH